MGIQQKLFEEDFDSNKISKMIRSNNYHQIGVELANNQGYNKVSLLIDLFYYHLNNTGEWWESRYGNKEVIGFVFGHVPLLFKIIESDNEAFYLVVSKDTSGKTDLVAANIKEWQEDEQFSDFDLFKIVEKYIIKNRITFDDIVKGRF